MMTKLLRTSVAVFALCFSALVSAGQEDTGQSMQRLGDWEVHYSAFPSTFLLPEIASQYDLTRSNSRAVLNISVLDATREDRAAQRVNVEGYTLNEAGQRRDLRFRRFVDGDAIYYVAQVPHGNEERFRFFVTIRQGDNVEELRFSQTFFRN